jgi:hypothetical protein
MHSSAPIQRPGEYAPALSKYSSNGRDQSHCCSWRSTSAKVNYAHWWVAFQNTNGA